MRRIPHHFPAGLGKTCVRLPLPLLLLAAGAGIAGAANGESSGNHAQAAAPLLAGAFTAEQAEEGKEVYTNHCAGCHGNALRGSPGGPAIAGFRFRQNWQGAPVSAYLGFITARMPPGKEGTLSDEEYVDAIAYILSRNGYPAGSTPLPTDSAKLDALIIEPIPSAPTAAR